MVNERISGDRPLWIVVTDIKGFLTGGILFSSILIYSIFLYSDLSDFFDIQSDRLIKVKRTFYSFKKIIAEQNKLPGSINIGGENLKLE